MCYYTRRGEVLKARVKQGLVHTEAGRFLLLKNDYYSQTASVFVVGACEDWAYTKRNSVSRSKPSLLILCHRLFLKLCLLHLFAIKSCRRRQMIDGIVMWAWPPCEGKILIFGLFHRWADHQSNFTAPSMFPVVLFGVVFRVAGNPKQPPAEDILQEFAGDRHPGKEHTPPHGQKAHSRTPSHLVCGTTPLTDLSFSPLCIFILCVFKCPAEIDK